ncbi:hypothetical protein GY45DRAFT_461738 [Cubamyces sp. BRFM 1775]|nr:hypothetical protein GY45DRAFT_461738 [Cubamyces sp. BRFM 1775]
MPPAQCTACKEVFASKAQTRLHHRQYLLTCSGARTVFICTECKTTFAKAREYKAHCASSGHYPDPLPTPRRHVPVSAGGPRARSKPKCPSCEEEFAAFHELAAHRRDKHAQQLPVTLQCGRCMEYVSYGEIHTCTKPEVKACAPELELGPEKHPGEIALKLHCQKCKESIPLGVVHTCMWEACSICKQTFTLPEYQEHIAENPVSCASCSLHLPPGTSLEDHWRLSYRHPDCERCHKGFKSKRALHTHFKDCAAAAAQAGPAASQTEWFSSGPPMLSVASDSWDVAKPLTIAHQAPESTAENAEDPLQALSARWDAPHEGQADSSAHNAWMEEYTEPTWIDVTDGDVDAEANTPAVVQRPPEEPQCPDEPVHEHGQHDFEPVLSIMDDQKDSEVHNNGEDAGEETVAPNPCSQPSPPPRTAEDLLKDFMNDLTPPLTPSPPPPPRTAEELLKSVMSRGPCTSRLTLRQPPLIPPAFSYTCTTMSSSEGAVRPTSTRASISTCSQEMTRTKHTGQSSETEKHPMLAERKGPTKLEVQDEFIPAKVLLQRSERPSARVAEWLYDQARRRSNCGWTVNVSRPSSTQASAGTTEVLPSVDPVAGIRGEDKSVAKPTTKADTPVNVHAPAERPPSSAPVSSAECEAVVNTAQPSPEVGIETAKDVLPAAWAASKISWHCRVCLMQPCVDPVVTLCGHIFCHRCIVEELEAKGICPVCEKLFYARLDL